MVGVGSPGDLSSFPAHERRPGGGGTSPPELSGPVRLASRPSSGPGSRLVPGPLSWLASRQSAGRSHALYYYYFARLASGPRLVVRCHPDSRQSHTEEHTHTKEERGRRSRHQRTTRCCPDGPNVDSSGRGTSACPLWLPEVSHKPRSRTATVVCTAGSRSGNRRAIAAFSTRAKTSASPLKVTQISDNSAWAK